MKVLFATSSSDCYVSACLWDGLQEVVGEANVYDAAYSPMLHYEDGTNRGPCWRVGGQRIGRCLDAGDCDFDLLVLNASFLSQHDWHWARGLRARLKPTGKVAFVEGDDSPNAVSKPPFYVDAVFRREMDGRGYPYGCHPLLMGAPSRWLEGVPIRDQDRPYDVFAPMVFESNELRWTCLQKLWSTERKHRSIGASCGVSYDKYFEYLRGSKLCLCPPGAGSDCMRHWEAGASGCIPIFVCLPNRVRDPWFKGDEMFWCESIDDLPRIIDHALGIDLNPIRQRLLIQMNQYHTTAARVKRMLSILGMQT